MSFDPEVDVLILRNLRVLDEASLRLVALTELVWKQMGASVERHLGCHGGEGWSWASGDWVPDSGGWFASTEWCEGSDPDDGGYEAWIEMEVGHGDSGDGAAGEDYHYLTRLVGAGKGHFRLVFRHELLKAQAWKKFRSAQSELFSGLDLPLDQGGNPQVAFRIDAERLAAAIVSGSFDEALEPLFDAIDRFVAAKPALDGILGGMRATPRAAGQASY